MLTRLKFVVIFTCCLLFSSFPALSLAAPEIRQRGTTSRVSRPPALNSEELIDTNIHNSPVIGPPPATAISDSSDEGSPTTITPGLLRPLRRLRPRVDPNTHAKNVQKWQDRQAFHSTRVEKFKYTWGHYPVTRKPGDPVAPGTPGTGGGHHVVSCPANKDYSQCKYS